SLLRCRRASYANPYCSLRPGLWALPTSARVVGGTAQASRNGFRALRFGPGPSALSTPRSCADKKGSNGGHGPGRRLLWTKSLGDGFVGAGSLSRVVLPAILA